MTTIRLPRDELAGWRRLRAWRRTAAYLNALGYPAIVPPELVTPLRRAGLAVWPGQRGAA